jgi:pimeloyl-ACP methyl ester carboxylesterase
MNRLNTKPRRGLPLILVRGFGGLGVEDEKRIAYQGFNDGTVYPQKRGENYIYEGLVLRLLKSDWRYEDATNVVGYYASEVAGSPQIPSDLADFPPHFFGGHKVVVDPGMALHLLRRAEDPLHTVWVLRYYDLGDRVFRDYAQALVRLIDFIRALAMQTGADEPPRVNIIAHSMGGLIVREAVQTLYARGEAPKHINKIVTLGTPHQGISFQVLGSWLPNVEAREELERFRPDFQEQETEPLSYKRFHEAFPLERLLTVVGTNYRSYGVRPASALNRLFAVGDEFGMNYNRSDGLVKQANAQIPGAPRTFVHKCHGGPDSLVTSREAFEIATRFFFGDVRVRLRFVSGRVKRGKDWFGKSEFFFGVSIKPRRVDFELFHQSRDAENCYGPFESETLDDEDVAFPWADKEGLIWEGWLDTSRILPDPSRGVRDLVMRLDFYVGERDLFGVGFSDNVIFRKQYYMQAMLEPEFGLFCYAGEEFMQSEFVPTEKASMRQAEKGWEFDVAGTGFEGTFRIELDRLDEE